MEMCGYILVGNDRPELGCTSPEKEECTESAGGEQEYQGEATERLWLRSRTGFWA